MSDERRIKKISEVKKAEPVRPVEKVNRVDAISRVRQPTLNLSSKDREKLLKMIEQEANELVKSGIIPKEDKDVVTKAVEYAITSAILDDEEE